MSPTLLSPVKVGNLECPNRVVLAPMTRGRCGASGLANADYAEYFAQRASAGLLITDGSVISDQAQGWWGAPRVYRPEDVTAWKQVTDAVHAKAGRIFCQLWHCGRASHSVFRPDAADGRGVAPSPIMIEGHEFAFTPKGRVKPETPRELTTDEIDAIPEEFRHAAQIAKEAGFDGVELHGANGYLLDAFLQSATNKRTDKYGGSLENRFRLIKACLEAVFTVFPSTSVAIRIGPNGVYNGMGSADFRESFLDYAQRLSTMNLAYLHVCDGLAFGFHNLGEPLTLAEVRKVYSGILMGNCGYTQETAEKAIASGDADLISFGRPYISNPDLVERFAKGAELNPPAEMSVFYSPGGENLGAKGYTDFPTLAQ
jgi:N-ethylmaleimide reductase